MIPAGLGPAELLVSLAMALGLVGCALPVVPGPPLMFLALLLYDVRLWLEGGLDGGLLALLGFALLAAVAGSSADWWLSAWLARRAGADRRSLALALVAGLAALLLLPVTGGLSLLAALVLPVLVVVLLEFRRDGDRRRSLRAGCGYLTGWALATAVEAAAGVGLLAIWLLQLDRLGF